MSAGGFGFVLAVDFADEIGVNRQSLYSMIRRGKLQASKYKGRLVIDRQTADAYAAEYELIRRRPAQTEV